METSFTFRDIDATEGLKDHVLDKFTKLDKYLIKPVSAHTILCKDGFQHKAEITILDNGTRYVGVEKTNDMYLSIDHAIEKIISQLKKNKERVKDHHKRKRI
ncbi:MAG: ribosome-associated translation inhibitor RaiA [Deltaproteobacteria bacterium]|nr:ribosome-associated translation inhibitor RaiA [Deltaproteobacteria bacterium]MBI2341267.1 ribosome-associated translation inhibitor RaiA [Deltaproteobacteria bacterium]MBI2974775.1 ribosome-associated translation inhibitor RaiA [Deltaproteobacteria bacterium]